MGTGHRQKMPLAGGSSGLDGPALTDAVVRSMEAGDGLSEAQFNALALAVFRYQFDQNRSYRSWCTALGWTEERVTALDTWWAIPAMPVEAFKWDDVKTEGLPQDANGELVFRTSGTTGSRPGVHTVRTPRLYAISAQRGFQRVFGPPGPKGDVLLGLLPGYLERPDSSLVHMVGALREAGWCLPGAAATAGFFLEDHNGLFRTMETVWEAGRRPVVIGVTWAMMDAAEAWHASGRSAIADRAVILETGGMKGRRRERVREEVHEHLQAHFGCSAVAGEYGMTELLSQAWSMGNGAYATPPWMRVRVRRTDDPFALEQEGRTGGLDVVDLANLGSCSFLSTQDLARSLPGDPGRHFEVLGRFDHAEVRGCNLMVD